jgi:methyl-accepting chemotaxis protein-1 (serine sensor receptor)
MSIQSRLQIAFGILALIVLGVSGYSLHALSATTEGFNHYVDGLSARAVMATSVREAVNRRAIAARNLVLVSDPADVATEKADALRAHADVQERLGKLQEMIRNSDASEQARKLVAQMAEVEQRYGPVATAIVGLALEQKREEASDKLVHDCRPLLATLVKVTEDYVTFTNARQQDMIKQLNDAYVGERNLLIIISLAAAALAVLFGMRVTSMLIRPMRAAVDVARTVASGDLGTRIEVTSRDETGLLLGALRDMNDRLAETVTRVRESSGSISTATSEIAAGNADLSSRTEEQAASLEQTAASLEELTETVRQNTDNATQATSLARNAVEVAQRGSGTVGRVVQTMEGISASSAKIADITGMIESIAFQTNILALNAAVEAARAGEQGRGFAVVASEVRNLAQRSSHAAKEIKELIETSVAQVRAGSVLAGEAGETMTAVTQAVARVTGIVEEIATASAEQSRGIGQVNQAVMQIDQATQQNAALVHQAATASRSLEEQGRQLEEMMAFFRLGNTARPLALTTA